MALQINIDYNTGHVFVTGAVNANGKEYTGTALRRAVRRTMAQDGIDVDEILVYSDTKTLVDWIERATRAPFERPLGEFVLHLEDTTDPSRFNGEELSQWPVKSS